MRLFRKGFLESFSSFIRDSSKPFLNSLLLYNLNKNSHILVKMLEDNNYEKEAYITKSLYT